MNNDLAVVTVVENPLGWRTRYDNYIKFKRHIQMQENVTLYTVEVAYKNDPLWVTNVNDDHNLRLRTSSEMWHKENALNLLMQRVQEDYIAWVDADILFVNPSWARDTVQQLQHYKIVQPFSHALYLGASGQPTGLVRPGYLYQYKTEGTIAGGVNFWGNRPKSTPPEKVACSGLACAASKQTWSELGGLIDWCIAGSGDFHMMAAYLGELNNVVQREGYGSEYYAECSLWQARCSEFIKGNVGYTPGLVCHLWHGNHARRKTVKYKNLTREFHFDPAVDIKYDWQGLYQWTDNNPELEEEVKKEMRSRNEDEKGEVLIP